VQFSETPTGIRLVVGPFGPRMASGEADRIFDLFFRGQKAAMLEPEGTGFGLYLAQFIAGRFRSQIRVFQEMSRKRSGRYWTEFAIELPKAST